MGEQEIIQLIRDRDHRGMDELLLHFGPLMRYIIAPILSDGRDREECLSEAAMRAWEKIELFNPEQGSWKGWLTALTRNAALNRARGLRGEVGELTEDIPSPAPMPEEALLRKERAEELKSCCTPFPTRTGLCSTESITICSPPSRSPGSWAPPPGRWRAGCTG